MLSSGMGCTLVTEQLSTAVKSANVLIGMNATILHDAELGNFCIIGAGCVVGEGMEARDNL